MNYHVDFIPEDETDNFDMQEKTKYIISKVMKNKILVLENALSPQEEAELIKNTMNEIDFTKFMGIKLFSFDTGEDNKMGKLFGRNAKKRSAFTIVAPDKAVTVVKDERGILSIRINA